MKKYIEIGFILIVILWLFTLISIVFTEGYDIDESTHSLVGMFIKDFIIDWFRNPTLSFQKIYNYGISYLTYYPKLSIHYPPLPQFFFTISFILFKSSVIISRLTVVVFSLITIILIYYMTLHLYKKKEVAIISCLILMSSSILISMSVRAVQEIFFLFFFTATIFSLLILLEKFSIKLSILFIISTVACILTKWHAVFILPVIFFYTLIFERGKFKLILICLILISVVLSPYYLILFKTGLLFLPFEANVMPEVGEPQWYQIDAWLYYPKVLITDLFSPLIGLLMLFLSFYYIKQKEKKWSLFLVWIIIGYVLTTLIPNKNPKYIINILPALVIPSAYVIEKYLKKNRIFLIILIILLFTQFIYSVKSLQHGIDNVEKINEVIKDGYNVGFVTAKDTSPPFIFEIAKNSSFQHQTFRPCIFLDLNQTPDNIIQNYSIKYVVVEKNIADKQLFEISKLVEKSYQKIADFGNFMVFENNKIIKEKETYCNYICSNRKIICSSFDNPKEALK